MNTIECPRCNSRMKEGFVADVGDASVIKPTSWVEGAPEKTFWGGTKTKGKKRFQISVFRCPRCERLEFFALEAKPVK